MKTIKLSLLAILFITFSSCSKDDDNNSDLNTSMMLGEWNLESFNYEGTSEANFEGFDFSTSYSGVSENEDFTLTFNENNTFESNGKYDVRLTVEGITQLVPLETTTSTGDWSVNGNILTTSSLFTQVNGSPTQSESISEMRITEITENRMVLSFDQESKVNQSGLDYTVTLIGEYILIK